MIQSDGGRFTVWVMKTWWAMAQSGQVNPSCHKHYQTMPCELKNRGDLIRNNQNTDSGKFTVWVKKTDRPWPNLAKSTLAVISII